MRRSNVPGQVEPFDATALEKALQETGALLDGHFLLSSGLHSPRYVQCARLLQHPALAERGGAAVAALFALERPQVVVSPALGGVVIGQEVGRALGVRAIFTERDPGGVMALRRGFTLEGGERVLLVEDAVTTGRSVVEVAALVRERGAVVVGAGALIDRRGQGAADMGFPLRAALTLEIPRYPADVCPLCREGRPAEKPGSRPSPQLR
jgi:orotate phosphoribosyltransferase